MYRVCLKSETDEFALERKEKERKRGRVGVTKRSITTFRYF